ncbi:MAG: sigma-70 family RNA polymerase sigma factor [Proteobacteria bacterium]|nr:sigma-70 family RNA polymerase sigma factor [Pseudomonadota bacterium]
MTSDPPETPDFATLYDRHFSQVYNYARWRLGDPAATDDVVSRVFERALAAFDRFDPAKGPVEAWLIGIARNAVMDHFRARRWTSWLPFDLFGDRPGPDPEAGAALAEDETRRELLSALKALDARERDLLALKFGAEMTNRAIAAQLGMTESNVGVIVHRAVEKLRAAMGEKR